MNLETMRTNVLFNLDDANQDVYSDTRLNRALNGAKDTVVAAIQQVDEGYFVTTSTFAVSASSTIHALPTDFRKVLYLERTDVDPPTKVGLIDWRQQDNYRYGNLSTVRSMRAYLKGTNIHFMGVSSAMSIAMDFGFMVLDVSATGSSFDGIPADYHDVVVTGATWRLLRSRNAPDTVNWRDDFNKQQNDMVTDLAERQHAEPEYVNLTRETYWGYHA